MLRRYGEIGAKITCFLVEKRFKESLLTDVKSYLDTDRDVISMLIEKVCKYVILILKKYLMSFNEIFIEELKESNIHQSTKINDY